MKPGHCLRLPGVTCIPVYLPVFLPESFIYFLQAVILSMIPARDGPASAGRLSQKTLSKNRITACSLSGRECGA